MADTEVSMLSCYHDYHERKQ